MCVHFVSVSSARETDSLVSVCVVHTSVYDKSNHSTLYVLECLMCYCANQERRGEKIALAEITVSGKPWFRKSIDYISVLRRKNQPSRERMPKVGSDSTCGCPAFLDCWK